MLTEQDVQAIFRYVEATAKFYKTKHEYEGKHDKTLQQYHDAWKEVSNAQTDLLRLVRR